MRPWQLAVSTALTLVGLAALLPGVVYVAGLAKLNGRPAPADPARFTQSAIAAAWEQCREVDPLAVRPNNPWRYAGTFLSAAPFGTFPGERAAWRIASRHNADNPVGSSFWWHTSGAALSIWVTRHWSAEQIGATLVRDELCK